MEVYILVEQYEEAEDGFAIIGVYDSKDMAYAKMRSLELDKDYQREQNRYNSPAWYSVLTKTVQSENTTEATDSKVRQSKHPDELVEEAEGKWACVYTTGELRDLYDFEEETDTYELATFDTEEEAYDFARAKIAETSDVYGHNCVIIYDPEGEEETTARSEYDI